MISRRTFIFSLSYVPDADGEVLLPPLLIIHLVLSQKVLTKEKIVFIETQIIFDKEHDHYQLLHTGWRNQNRIYGCVLHLDIKDGKNWIQHDGTEIGIANELVELGVPKEDIVLAFHDPYSRKFTGFAIH